METAHTTGSALHMLDMVSDVETVFLDLNGMAVTVVEVIIIFASHAVYI